MVLVKKVLSVALYTVNVWCSAIAIAQEIHYTHYSVDQGLPGSQVHDVVQDAYGHLWFATDQGLARYDGYEFKIYTIADGLTDNNVFKFFPQQNGDIWCTTLSKDIFCIRGNEPAFIPYRFNKLLHVIPDFFVENCICFSDDGSLYASMVNGGGYVRIDSSGKMLNNSLSILHAPHETFLLTDKNDRSFFYVHKKEDKSPIPENWVRIISSGRDSSGGYVKACDFRNRKCAVFMDTKNIFLCADGAKVSLAIDSSFEPIALGKLNDTLFWAGFRYGGVGIFDLNGKKIRSLLQGKSITKMLMDHEGGYWLSTLNDGVFYISNTALGFCQTPDNWVNSLTKDQDDNLWIGFYNGNITVRGKSGIAGKHQSVRKKPAHLAFNKTVGKVYFISDGHLFSSESKTPLLDLKDNQINMYAHQNDSVVISSYRAVQFIHGGKKKQIMTGFRVNDLCYHKGKFYVAGNMGLYEIEKQALRPYSHTPLPASKINSIISWNDKLVLAVEGKGILIIQNDSVYRIDQSYGLSRNTIKKMRVGNDTVLWACTNSGLNRIIFKDGKVKSIRIISANDGLISNEVTDVAIIRDTVWAGTRKGLCFFPVSLPEQTKKITGYYLTISHVKANDNILGHKAVARLTYDQNRIEFGFKAISFHTFSPLVYRYMLKGLESRWNYTKGLSALYTSLPPGNYTFIVEVKGDHADWKSEHREFTFTIAPPYWKTWWFRLSVTALVAAMVYLFFRFRILSYNRDITRELLRQLLKRLSKQTNYVVFKEQGKDIRVATSSICFVKASGNYIEIQTDTKKYVIRYKIGSFLDLVPDPLEYLRINRSCVVRLDKIQEKSKKDVTILGEKIAVGETYIAQLQKIKF